MELAFTIGQFADNTRVFIELLAGIQEEQYNWRPAPDKWNLKEVLYHLRDEEREDFRPRIQSLLEDPSKPFKPIHPEKWVKGRNYATKEFNRAFNSFMQQRQISMEWLKSLDDPDWTIAYQHEKLGPLSAMLLLENWVAHDLLHIRQIVNIKLAYLDHIASEPLDYAGGV